MGVAKAELARATRTPLVYTSFDGDHLHLVDSICYTTHALGRAPVNPEAALGYYLSTTHHGGTKLEVMRDCVALELACSEFWIFSRKSIVEAGELPEGVIAELLLWRKRKPDGPIRLFDLDKTDACFFDPASEACALPISSPSTPESNAALYQYILDRHESSNTRELNDGFLQDVERRGMRELAFLSIDPREVKHVDWARAKVYELGKVPFSPDTLIRYFPLRVAANSAYHESYLSARAALLLAADDLFIFLRPQTAIEPELPCWQVLLDLALWKIGGKSLESVHFFTWTDAKVPKFLPVGQWALTTSEDRQTKGLRLRAHKK